MYGQLRILEIGCWEGQATRWFLERFLQATVEVIDTFGGNPEHIEKNMYDLQNLRKRFDANTEGFVNRLIVHVGKSEDILPTLWKTKPHEYDLIYVDGSHAAIDVFTDGVWSWRLLRQGGILAFDDYTWRQDRPPADTPKQAIDYFLKHWKGQYELLHKKACVIIKKL